ncbi:multiheme c-type cytochrome [Rubripirellula tenax]|uniref:multiheme c-type cytochrome n=1 Tax=Rubripirellula tenax TaxID=2528015 RepID=UPI001FE3ABE3|nr:multiheme c-type cytochrome [Rubripirellula tenax]
MENISRGHRDTVSEMRRRRAGVVSGAMAIGLLVVGAVGCSPPALPMTPQADLAVGMPTGQSSDPGTLSPTGIAAPSLLATETHSTQPISFRMNVQTTEAESGFPGRFDSGPFDQSSPFAGETFASEAVATQLIQIPQGPQPGSIIEVIPTPKGERDPAFAKPVEAAEKAMPAEKESPANVTPPAKEDVTETMDATAKAESPSASVASTQPAMAIDPTIASKAEPSTTPSTPVFPNALDGPEDYTTWDRPSVALVFTGQQHGYIEPCGCTGLDRQKGGVARRFTFIESLTDRGWDVVPMDAGNQVRRFGKQAAIKLQQSVRALDEMKYQAVGFGPDDVRLGVGDLLALAAEEDFFVSANVVLFDPEYLPRIRIVEKNGMKIGVTSVLDPDAMEVAADDALTVSDPLPSLTAATKDLAAKSPDYSVLLYFGKEDAAKELVRKVAGFDLVVAAGGYGEPTYQAESIEGSKTRIIVTGDKGMYAGIIGLYPDGTTKYARVPLTHEFADAPQMRGVMADYQNQLRDIGLGGLGLLPPIKHSSTETFVGSEACGKCHTNAYAVWESSAHAEATEHLVHPPKERSDIARHFDPECISCHVTGWNAQDYYPYETGYLSLEETSHLTGNGCENCHGPGAGHAAAEAEGATVEVALRDKLRESMKLPLEKAREKCMTCHDLDNSPDFHEPDAFEDIYWPEVEHYGLD